MHEERIQNVHPLWVAAGWLVAIAMTSLIALTLAALGLMGPEVDSSAFGAVVSIALGFWVGGFVTGFRATRAPFLHGILIGFASIVAWFLVNLVAALFPTIGWEALTPLLTATLLLIQMTAAVAGAWVGHRIALRGGTELQG